MTIAFVSSSSAKDGSVSTLEWAHDNSTGDYLVVRITYYDTHGPRDYVTGVTYNGVAMIKAPEWDHLDLVFVEMWYLKNPSSGSNTVSITASGPITQILASATSYSGVWGIGNAVVANANDLTPTLDIASAAGELVVDAVAWVSSATGGATPGAGQTERWDDLYSAFNLGACGSDEAGAASVTMSWTLASGGNWAQVAMTLLPSAPTEGNKQLLIGGSGGVDVANWTYYAPHGHHATTYAEGNNTEDRIAPLLSKACTVRRFKVHRPTAPGVGNWQQFVVYRNGAPTALVVKIRETATEGETTDIPVQFAAGDTISVYRLSYSVPDASRVSWTIEVESASTSVIALFFGHGANVSNPSYLPFAGGLRTWAASEDSVKSIMPAPGTITSWRLKSLGPTGDRVFGFVIRVNGVDQAASLISVSNGDAGPKTVSGLSITFARGDFVSIKGYYISGSSGTSNAIVGGIEYTLDAGGSVVGALYSAGGAEVASKYLMLNPGYAAAAWLASTPALIGNPGRQYTLSELIVNLPDSSPGAGNTRTFKLLGSTDGLTVTGLECTISDTNQTGGDLTNIAVFEATHLGQMEQTYTGTPSASSDNTIFAMVLKSRGQQVIAGALTLAGVLFKQVVRGLAGALTFTGGLGTPDIRIRLAVKTGSAGNTTLSTPATSLGKYISTTDLTNSAFENLFANITADQAVAGRVIYKCIFVLNNDLIAPATSTKLWIASQIAGGGSIAIGLDPAGIVPKGQAGAQAAEIADETTAPAGVSFSTPTTEGTALSIGTIDAGKCAAVWVRLTIPVEVPAIASDGAVLTFGFTFGTVERTLLWSIAATPTRIGTTLPGTAGIVKYGFRYEKRDADNNFLADISSAVISGSIDLDNTRPVVRTGQFTIDPEQLTVSFEPLSDHFAVFMELLVDQALVSFQLGLFHLSLPQETHSPGKQLWHAQASDQSIHLVESTTEVPYAVATGTNFITAVRTILNNVGVRHSLPVTTLTLPVDMTWEAGTPWMTVVNNLLTAVNMLPIYTDVTGRFTTREWSSLTTRTPDVVYTGEDMILIPFKKETDTTIANKIIAIAEDPNRGELYSTKINSDPGSPVSTVTLGRTITKVIKPSGPIASQTVLDEIAQRALEDAAALHMRSTLTTPLDPRRQPFEVYQLTVPNVVTDDVWQVQRWKMDLKTGGKMEHGLFHGEKVISS